MITIDNKPIKLQIWDMVMLDFQAAERKRLEEPTCDASFESLCALINTNLHRYELSSELSSSTLETLPQHHAEHQNQSNQGSISSREISREVPSGGHPCRRRVKSEGGTVRWSSLAASTY